MKEKFEKSITQLLCTSGLIPEDPSLPDIDFATTKKDLPLSRAEVVHRTSGRARSEKTQELKKEFSNWLL